MRLLKGLYVGIGTACLLVAIACLVVVACYHLPEWNGRVDVTPVERAAIGQCGDGALSSAGALSISRHPYLQRTTTTSTTVVWGAKRTDTALTVKKPTGELVATIDASYVGDPKRQQARLRKLGGDDHDLKASNIYLVAADVEGLEPSHLYCYQLVADGRELTELAPLTTAATAEREAPIQFIAVGDTGTGRAAQSAIANQMTAQEFDFMLFLGDIAYSSGTATQLQTKFFQVYGELLRYVPSFPTLGNHERRTRNGAPYLEAFVLPKPERYYSFDWGNVHFVALDTTKADREQLNWLDANLAANTRPFVIAFGHHPLYTNSLRGPQSRVRNAFDDVFIRHRVDLVLAGHEHHYERFRIRGINYIVSGGGGGRITRLFGKTLALKQKAVHHFLHVSADAEALTVRAINIDGKVFEEVVLERRDKPSPTPLVAGPSGE